MSWTRFLTFVATAMMASCFVDSPAPEGTWTFLPDELVFDTKVGTRDVREFTIVNNGEAYIEIAIGRPVGDGNCPEEPFTPPPSITRIAPNSSQTIRIEHAPEVVPVSGTCIFRIQLSQVPDGPNDTVDTDKRTLRLDGGVRDADEDGDGVGRGSGDCNDRPVEVDPNAPLINPNVQEKCNGIDDDCDGLVDDADDNEPLKWDRLEMPYPDPLIEGQDPFLPDADGDSWPREGAPLQLFCDQPLGYVAPPDPTTTASNGGYDCNDQVFEIYPDAPEIAGDGVDRNCDSNVTCYADTDRDGFGNRDPGSTVKHPLTLNDPYCGAAGVSRISGDCDDSRGDVNPGSIELCDPGDEDCDLLMDDADPSVSQGDQVVWFYDGDRDGFGTSAIYALKCQQPADYVPLGTDCNDTNPDIFPSIIDPTNGVVIAPGGTERCNGIDEDCDGVPDDGANDPTTWYADRDGDGFGIRPAADPADTTLACNQPLGYVNNDSDCNDRNGLVNDFAREDPADGLDADCDGFELCYQNLDRDNFGTPTLVPAADFRCLSSQFFSNNKDDCDDTDDETYPGAVEKCDNNKDNDCDNRRDDDDADVSADAKYYRDQDADGYGDPGFPRLACAPPIGFVEPRTIIDPITGADRQLFDCDDTNPSVNPDPQFSGAASTTVEYPANGIDETCDNIELCWPDLDRDGYGDAGAAAAVPGAIGDIACISDGVSANKRDCDDNRGSINPGAVEVCDPANTDEDCNGNADDNDRNPVGAAPWFLDDDNDGFGSNQGSVLRCDRPARYVDEAGDCNDANAAINPDGNEICNGADDDCDGSTDDNEGPYNPATGGGIDYADPTVGATRWFQDRDDDGWGNQGVTVVRCAAPLQHVAASGDCDDDNPDVRPGAFEVIADGEDYNCDGLEDCYIDADFDTWGSAARTTVDVDLDPLCTGAGVTDNRSDCDDSRGVVSPSAIEVCDGLDNDCDNLADDFDDNVFPGTSDDVRYLRDADADGYGNPGDVRFACSDPIGFVPFLTGAGVAAATDCNDGNILVYPGANEVIADGVDQDCDRADACYRDADGDRYGQNSRAAGTSPSLTCLEPGLSPNSQDCNDTNPVISPAGTEVCDALDRDEDCDGVADDADGSVIGGTTWFLDSDGDGEGNPALAVVRCERPTGFINNANDCNDNNTGINTTATERCDALNLDENCDGVSDDLDTNVDVATYKPFYPDLDGDGYGDANEPADLRCDPDINQVANRDDCRDDNPSVRPGGTEVTADGLDSNCDGFESCYCNRDGDTVGSGTTVRSADFSCAYPNNPSGSVAASCNTPGVPVAPTAGDCDDTNAGILADQTAWFLDGDADSFGNPNVFIVSCQRPASGNWTTDARDCADNNAAIRPGVLEKCDPNNRDENCNGFADNDDYLINPGGVDASTLQEFWPDADADGYGDRGASATDRCDAEFAEVKNNLDCNDNNLGVKPGATELPADGVDSDCNGTERCYIDSDNDDFGTNGFVESASLTCAGPGVAPVAGDCDDTNFAVKNSQTLWYLDDDGDGYGNPSIFVLACTAPGSDWKSNGGDCADGDPTRAPNQPEKCDALDLDEDCDGLADNTDPDIGSGNPVVTGAVNFYVDADRDGFGAGAAFRACDDTSTISTLNTDCADADATRYPTAPETTADNVDQNCDGIENCYLDADNDNFGVASVATITLSVHATCAAAPNRAENANDCNDANALLQTGNSLWFFDNDGDGEAGAEVFLLTCQPPSLVEWMTDATDCNDEDDEINTSATEACNFYDDDCDGEVDEGAAAPRVFWRDADADTFGTPNLISLSCNALGSPPAGFVAPSGLPDCDDSTNTRRPGAAETCNGIDDDCDAAIDDNAGTAWRPDADGDGTKNATASAITACLPPPGYVADTAPTDCADADPERSPNLVEVCDGKDNNCDTTVDNGAIDALLWWSDNDNDGFGDAQATAANAPQTSCTRPTGGVGRWVVAGLDDCNDSAAATHPGAPEVCDGADNDCDLTSDDGLGPQITCYADADGDGFGGGAALAGPICATECVGTRSPFAGDCAVNDPTVHPAADEVCNGEDDDCDGEIDLYADCGGAWWAKIDDVVYLGFDANDTWFEAEATCAAYGYRLVWLESSGEATDVIDEFGPLIGDFWSGYRFNVPGCAAWGRVNGDGVCSTTPALSTNENGSFPSGPGAGDGVMIDVSDGTWDKKAPTDEFSFVCELP